MSPTLERGDKLICHKVGLDIIKYVDRDYIFLVMFNNGLEAIRRIKDRGEEVELIADNKEWGSQTVSKSDILSLYRVMASARVTMY